MGLFDKLKDKAAETVQGAKDRVSEATGVDTDALIETAGSLKDAAESVSDAAESFKDGRQSS